MQKFIALLLALVLTLSSVMASSDCETCGKICDTANSEVLLPEWREGYQHACDVCNRYFDCGF